MVWVSWGDAGLIFGGIEWFWVVNGWSGVFSGGFGVSGCGGKWVVLGWFVVLRVVSRGLVCFGMIPRTLRKMIFLHCDSGGKW